MIYLYLKKKQKKTISFHITENYSYIHKYALPHINVTAHHIALSPNYYL